MRYTPPLTDRQKAIIRQMQADGETASAIARRFNVSPSTVTKHLHEQDGPTHTGKLYHDGITGSTDEGAGRYEVSADGSGTAETLRRCRRDESGRH